jgi:23S rRNA pseudouridine1911/1915/1917 synthase
LEFRVVEENEDWIVVDKPAGLLIHPSKPDGRRTLWHGLSELLAFEIASGGQVSVINRLDRETSGLVLVAKTAAAARRLSMQMQNRMVKKEYLALVWNWPEEDVFTVDNPILRRGEVEESEVYLMQKAHPKGTPAVTHFRVLQRVEWNTSNGDKFALVHADLVTGRMHQVRVHLASKGHPVVGDKIYGPSERWYLDFIDRGWTPEMEAQLLMARHALHCAMLEIPGEGRWESALPGDMQEFLNAARQVQRD